MKRRSFLAVSAACAAFGLKTEAAPKLLKPPVDLIWVEFSKTKARWIENPFIKIELNLCMKTYDGQYINVEYSDASTSKYSVKHNNTVFHTYRPEHCVIYTIIKDQYEYTNTIPMTNKKVDRGNFYAETTRRYKNCNIDFYEIYNNILRGDEVTTYSNLYAVIGERLDGN